jgi:hypothetical protein
MPIAALSRLREITDTEEVTGSNPVSPTSIWPSHRLFPTRSIANVPNVRQIPKAAASCQAKSGHLQIPNLVE